RSTTRPGPRSRRQRGRLGPGGDGGASEVGSVVGSAAGGAGGRAGAPARSSQPHGRRRPNMKALLPPLPQPENQPDFAAGQDGPAQAHPPARSASAIAARNLSNPSPTTRSLLERTAR